MVKAMVENCQRRGDRMSYKRGGGGGGDEGREKGLREGEMLGQLI